LINLSKIDRRQNLTHKFDLTETEHYHDFVEVVFILNGQGTQVLEGNEYLVSAGDVFVLQGNQRHYFKDASNVEIVNLMFDAESQPDMINNCIRLMDGYKALFILEPHFRAKHNFNNMLRLKRNELASIELILNAMFMEQENKWEGYDVILSNRFEELIILLSRNYSKIDTNKAKALVRISKVLDFLENNYSENLNIDDLAEKAIMSKRNFMRIFRGAVGLSPIHYLKQVRLQKARTMLRDTNLQVTEISDACGFTDSNYFIKCFKSAYSTTPFKYRMRFKKLAVS
jgi:AraC-like DNA-binding protein